MESAIRHLSSISTSTVFAAAEFEQKVHLFEKGKQTIQRSIDTHLDFGGNRIQIIPEKNILITGAYNRFGLEAYNLATGDLVWKRKDLRKLQSVRYRPAASVISCFCDDTDGQIL